MKGKEREMCARTSAAGDTPRWRLVGQAVKGGEAPPACAPPLSGVCVVQGQHRVVSPDDATKKPHVAIVF